MENRERIADRDAWMLGIYIRDALQSISLLVNGFVPKGAKPQEYPKQPMLEKAQEEKSAESRKKKEENQMQMQMALFQAMAEKFNKNFNRKKEQEQKQDAITT